MSRVAVIGAGVIGASVAYHLAAAGAEVVVLEGSQPGQGTSSSSFAWTNANQKEPRDYFDLNAQGMREHVRLGDEIGSAPWLNPGGNLWWTGDPNSYDQLRSRVARLQTWGYAAEWLHAVDVNRDLEPDVRFPDPNMPVAFFPEESWIDAPSFVRTLLEHAAKRGATIRTDAPVAGIRLDRGRADLDVEGADPVVADAVVNCAGPAADRVAALAGRTLPLSPTRGLLVIVQSPKVTIRRVLHTSATVNFRPDGGRRIMLHHDAVDVLLGGRDRAEPDDPLCRELVTRARRVLPDLSSEQIVDVRVGTRPYPRDGRSSFGAVSSLPGYYEAVTHSGATMAPVIGRLLASELLTGQVDPLAASFRPDRFS